MYKIFVDTLMKKDPDNKGQKKFDKQAISFFVAFLLSIGFGITNLLTSYITGIVNNPTADNVFNSFMFLTAGLSGANIVNKFVDMQNPRQRRRDYYDDDSNYGGMNNQYNNDCNQPNNPYSNDLPRDTDSSSGS